MIQYCIAWTKVIERIPPAPTAAGDDDRHEQGPDPLRRTRHERQRQPGALELRHEVQPADRHDEHRGEPAHEHDPSRASAKSGSV